MDYLKIYTNLISIAVSKNRRKVKRNSKDYTYYEVHHITPKSFFVKNGGWIASDPDIAENLVLLTAKEHFVAHHLLCKIYNYPSIQYAFWAMCNQASGDQERRYKITCITYESAKKNFSLTHSKTMTGERNPNYKRIFTEEERKLVSERMTRIRQHTKWGHSDEEKKNRAERMTGARNPQFGKVRSAEHRKRMSDATKGRKLSEERKKQISITSSGENNGMYGKVHTPEAKRLIGEKNRNKPKLTCPHCNKVASKTNSKRWHFDNCHLLRSTTTA